MILVPSDKSCAVTAQVEAGAVVLPSRERGPAYWVTASAIVAVAAYLIMRRT